MCEFKHDCVGESFYQSKIDYGCKEYNIDNLWFDTKYLDCEFLDKKVQDRKLMPIKTYNKLFKIINNVNSGLVKLCDTKEDFENLLCEAYDLRDVCKNLPDCIEFYLKKYQ